METLERSFYTLPDAHYCFSEIHYNMADVAILNFREKAISRLLKMSSRNFTR